MLYRRAYGNRIIYADGHRVRQDPPLGSLAVMVELRIPRASAVGVSKLRDEARNSSGKVIYYTSYYQYGNHGTWHRAYSNGTEQYGRFWLDSNGRVHEEVTRKSMTKGKTRSINNSRKGIYQ